MGTSYTPTTIVSGFQSNDILNTEFTALQTELVRMVNRFGDTPNFMEADFDLNSNSLLNVLAGVLGTDGVNLAQVQNLIAAAISTSAVDSDQITWNFRISLGSEGAATRTVFDMDALHGVTSFNSITVVVNGVIQVPGLSYGVAGAVITFTESLDADSNIMFIYGDLTPLPALPNILLDAAGGYDVGTYYDGVTTASDVIFHIPVTRQMYLPDGATGSRSHARTAATASTVFDIQREEISIGSMTFGIAGQVPTYTVSGDQQFEINETFALVGPVTPDATLADIGVNFKMVLGTP